MFLKNLIYAFRNLWRDKFYTLLNGLGLAIGIAAALLIFIWANDELSFDNFHSKGDRIHRILTSWSFAENEELISTVPFPIAESAKSQIPEIEKMTLVGQLWGTIIRHGEKRFDVKETKLVYNDFFEIFDFPFLHGNPETAFDKPNNTVITKSMALQIYGSTDVIGQPLELVDKMDLIVSAVLEDLPTNSHLQFKMLIPFEANYKKFYGDGGLHWGAFNFDSYLLLRPGIEIESVNKKLSALVPIRDGETAEDKATFKLQRLTDIYLGSGMLGFSRASRGDWTTIKIISGIGLLILLIACINYVNMTTARSAHRAKATGVRKMIGASKWQLFIQFMMEVIVLVGISSVLAFALANVSLGLFEKLSGKHFTHQHLITSQTLIIFLSTSLLAIILAGIQPALKLSSFQPLEALRGSNFKGVAGKGGLRKILVTTQFACSGSLIICTIIMLAQLDFVKKQKLGYNKEHIFSFQCQKTDALLFKNQLQGLEGIKEITVSNDNIADVSNRYGGFDFEGKDPEADPYLFRMSVAESFPEFFGLELEQGRWFLEGNRDSSSFILNQKAVSKLGIKDPIGKWFNFNGMNGKIVGVAKDFHFRSFHHEIDQLVFVQDFRWGMKRIYVKTTGEEAAAAIASVQKTFATLEPEGLFDYKFLDESYDNLYKTESRSSSLLALFAGLAIFISCLGILGLAAYTAERRRKEIGVRKVLGASITNIVALLSKDFLSLVVIALIIASPIAWYLMQGWLENFAYSITIKWWVFAIAGLIAISIAFLTVSFQSLKAALSNPTDSLRSE